MLRHFCRGYVIAQVAQKSETLGILLHCSGKDFPMENTSWNLSHFLFQIISNYAGHK